MFARAFLFRYMKKILEFLNRISLKKKLVLIQVLCVILPLVITDSVILGIFVNAQKDEEQRLMNNVSDSVSYTLSEYRDQATSLLQDVYMNKKINQFNNKTFLNNLDYVAAKYELNQDTLFTVKLSSSRFKVTIYSTAIGLVDGGGFQKLENAFTEDWYQDFIHSDEEVMLHFDYVQNGNYRNVRDVSVIRKLDYLKKNHSDNIVKIDFNYADMLTALDNAKYANKVYVCYEDTILFTNDGDGGIYSSFKSLDKKLLSNIGYVGHINLYDKTLDIYVATGENITISAIKDNLWIVVLLVVMNVVIPLGVMMIINKSFTERLKALTDTLRNNDEDELVTLPEASGEDEIGLLMRSYNDMAERINDLIENEYKIKLKQQESDIARQKAEILALHSQINPHFLFNALESIRMHSIIKKENETATMVEKLALMQRQNVDWGNDSVTVADEIKFVEAYLELQKYRFGNKLNYEINVDEDCQQIRLPKITLVTFVENACIHGMEKKTSFCWIFVRISREFDELLLEVEDTGNGISEEQRLKLLDEINNVNIQMLQENRSIGILNAALRLKMHTDNRCKFEVDSEPGAGTMVTIRIPIMEEDKNA